jgi:hypothetical protein
MKGDAFLVYDFLPHDPKIQHEIPFQYKNYKDVFEKNNNIT